jgi:hypothetical protein
MSTSSTTASGGAASIFASAWTPSLASSTSKPFARSARSSDSRTATSSSAIRMFTRPVCERSLSGT